LGLHFLYSMTSATLLVQGGTPSKPASVKNLMMDSVVESLILDLLEWVTKEERSYEQVADAWRTSCPKLPVWEDATDRGLVTTELINGRWIVNATPSGRALLQERRRLAP
jgi:hypothetical protein